MRDLTPELRRRCAIMLAQQGDLAAAIKTLESKSIMLETDGQLLLADLYRRANRVADAKLIYEKLIEAKPTELDVLRAAAAFYAQQQDKGRAEEILAKIDSARLRPGGREILQAEYEERFGSPGAADAAYVSATHAAPDDEAAWAALVGYRIRQQHFVEAQQAADEGLSRIQKSAELAALKSAAVALGASADEAIDLRPLADTFAANPDHPAVKSLIAAVEDSRAKKLPTTDALAAARKVIDQYPRFPALQLALVQWTLKLGQIDEAIRIVSRAMEQFPGNPDAPRLATAVYRAAGKWDLMAASATRWRERTLDNPRHADIALAVARFHLNDPVGALKILQPYLTKNPDPVGDAELITAAARAHAAANHPTDAENLLEPLLDKDGSWRAVWLTIAASDLTTAPSAEAWLSKIAPRISDDAPAEQYALANACYTASRRLNSKPLRDKCIAILDNLIKRPDATFAPFALHGLIAEQDGDFKLAEAAYRRSLSMNPNQPGPLNNLAYLILLRGGDLNEAKNLVGQAIALEPQAPEFYDTLARIQAKSDNADAAVESFQKALRLDPNSLQALIGLASTYTAAGKKDAAAPLLNQIDVLLKARPNLSPALRDELDAVRSTIKAVSN
jgi:predicted Zn-dependent protease